MWCLKLEPNIAIAPIAISPSDMQHEFYLLFYHLRFHQSMMCMFVARRRLNIYSNVQTNQTACR